MKETVEAIAGLIAITGMFGLLAADVVFSEMSLSLEKLKIVALIVGLLLAGDAVVKSVFDQLPFSVNLTNNDDDNRRGDDRGMVSVIPMLWLTGLTAMSIAVYLQFVGRSVPMTYALVYYLLGVGLLLVVYRVVWALNDTLLIVGLLSVFLSELVGAYAVARDYEVHNPVRVMRGHYARLNDKYR